MKLSEILPDWIKKREFIPKNCSKASMGMEKDGQFNGYPRGMKNEVMAHYQNGYYKGAVDVLSDCDREIDREALARVLAEVQSCPNPDCGDKGWYVGEATTREYVTRDMALDAGDKNLEGSVYREAEQEQVQCEFCYTNSLSKFNLADHIISTMPTWLKRIEE